MAREKCAIIFVLEFNLRKGWYDKNMDSTRSQLSDKNATANKPESWVLWGLAVAALYVVADMILPMREAAFPSLAWGFILFASLAVLVTQKYGMPDLSRDYYAFKINFGGLAIAKKISNVMPPRDRKLTCWVWLMLMVFADFWGWQGLASGTSATISFWEYTTLLLASCVIAWTVGRGGVNIFVDFLMVRRCFGACLLLHVIFSWVLSFHLHTAGEEFLFVAIIAFGFSVMVVRLFFWLPKNK